VRNTPESIKDYFGGPSTGFLSKSPAITQIPERVIQMCGPDAAIDSGTYYFSLAVSTHCFGSASLSEESIIIIS
jgi:hypothetical protein